MEAAELPEPMPALRRPGVRLQLGALLLREKLLSTEQLEEALAEKDETGDRLGEIVVRRGWLSGRALAHALAEQHELEYIDLAQTEIEALALSLLPERRPEEQRFRLWCDPRWCAVLLGLFTLYWIGRKVGGLT